MEESHSKSIRVKLVEIFVMVSITVFVIVIFIYYNLNRTIREMDTVYNSNIQFNDLSANVSDIQNSLYQYLNTKSSDALEDYYRYSQDYQELLDVLNQEVSSDPAKLAEKNIYYLSQTYLEMTDEAVERKRGRDAAGVREAYQETEEIYGFIQANINSINTSTFVSNARSYSNLRVILSYTTGFSICVLFSFCSVFTCGAVFAFCTAASCTSGHCKGHSQCQQHSQWFFHSDILLSLIHRDRFPCGTNLL